MIGIQVTVTEDQNRITVFHRIPGMAANALQRLFHFTFAPGGVESDVDGVGLEMGMINMLQFAQLLIAQHRLADLYHAAMLRAFLQQIEGFTDKGLQGHDHLFTDRVDRRVGHLGEELLEIVGQMLRLIGQHRQGVIGAHGTQGLLGRADHIGKNQ